MHVLSQHFCIAPIEPVFFYDSNLFRQFQTFRKEKGSFRVIDAMLCNDDEEVGEQFIVDKTMSSRGLSVSSSHVIDSIRNVLWPKLYVARVHGSFSSWTIISLSLSGTMCMI